MPTTYSSRRVAGASSFLLLASLLACAPSRRPGAVYVVREPPAERVEVIGAAPGREYVHLRGHYVVDRGEYLWVPGRWERIPRGRRSFVEGHWARAREGWYWVDGHWR